MDKIWIQGGKPLRGTVEISGSKNAALPILAASLLGESPSVIHNIPNLQDIQTLVTILTSLGAKVEWAQAEGTMVIDPTGLNKAEAPYELVKKMRASICFLGPLIGKLGKARVSMPGGCVIGPRPVDLHLKGLEALNVRIEVKQGYICAETKELLGNEIFLGGRFGSSVLATANVMMAAVKAKGLTVIESAACEPEIEDLAHFLTKMGAQIEGAGSHVMKIRGVPQLRGAEHSVISDRIEAGTYMMAAAMTGGQVRLKGAKFDTLHGVTDKLRQAGVSIQRENGDILVDVPGPLQVVDVITLPYPGFPTDLQAQMMAMMSVTEGISVITEKIYPERFMHVAELNRMSACVSLEGASAIVKGVSRLNGAPVMASDLRASAALVLAGLVAQGETEIHRVYHIDRGYENIEKKLSLLGADIKRIKEN